MNENIYSNINAFHSLSNIVKLVTGEPIEDVVKKDVVVPTSRTKTQKKELIKENFANEDTKLAIQNEPKFMGIINVIRKIKPFTAVYVENGSHLVLVLASSMHFPVVFVKLELIYPMIQANGIDDIWYEFPLTAVTGAISKSDKDSNRYGILFQEKMNVTEIKYISPLDKNERSLGNVVKISKMETLKQIFYNDRINSQDEFQEDIGADIDYSQIMNNMTVLMISEAKDFGNFEKSLGAAKLEYATHTLSIKHRNISLLTSVASLSRTSEICNSQDCLYWKDSFDVVTDMKMFSFASLFKNADRLKSKSDFSYYILCDWKKYRSGFSTFMLIKLLINRKLEIDNYTKVLTFESLIANGNSIYEMFECYCPTSAIESGVEEDYYFYE